LTCTITNIMKREIIEVRAAIMLTKEQKEQQDREATELQFAITDTYGKTSKSRMFRKRVPEYMQELFNSITARILLQDILEIETENIGSDRRITARLVIETTKETAERIKEMRP
jgi:hypothetical protein